MKNLKNSPLNYSVQFFFNKEPLFENIILLGELKKIFRNVNILFSTNSMISFVLNDYSVNAEAFDIPIQILLIKESYNSNSKKILESIEHYQLNDNLIDCIDECKFLLVISDFMGTSIEYKERVTIFNKIIKTLIPILSCRTIYWSCSQKFIQSIDFLDALEKESVDSIFGIINVRHFIKEDEHIMDTLGLSSIGLPDLQCSFNKAEPGVISTILYEYARKIFKHGDFLNDNEEISSMNLKFICNHSYSTTKPKRIIIEFKEI